MAEEGKKSKRANKKNADSGDEEDNQMIMMNMGGGNFDDFGDENEGYQKPRERNEIHLHY